MKRSLKTIIMSGALIALSAVSSISAAEGKLTGNIGFTTDYFYRGFDQGTGATASAGLDYDLMDGIAIGVWAADVGDGIEYDLYGAYSGEFDEFTYSVGFTGYFYTGDVFDDTYTEINLNGGFGPFSVEVAIGKHDLVSGGDEDYSFLAGTFEHEAYYVTFGTFSQDIDGTYFELGYNTTIAELDTTLALISSDDDIGNSADGGSDISMTLSFVKNFDL